MYAAGPGRKMGACLIRAVKTVLLRGDGSLPLNTEGSASRNKTCPVPNAPVCFLLGTWTLDQDLDPPGVPN